MLLLLIVFIVIIYSNLKTLQIQFWIKWFSRKESNEGFGVVVICWGCDVWHRYTGCKHIYIQINTFISKYLPSRYKVHFIYRFFPLGTGCSIILYPDFYPPPRCRVFQYFISRMLPKVQGVQIFYIQIITSGTGCPNIIFPDYYPQVYRMFNHVLSRFVSPRFRVCNHLRSRFLFCVYKINLLLIEKSIECPVAQSHKQILIWTHFYPLYNMNTFLPIV